MDRAIKKKTFTLKRVILGLMSLSFVTVVVYYAVWGDHSKKYKVDSERLTIARVEFGEFMETTPAPGTLVPKNVYHLVAVEGGRVAEIYVKPGDDVVEGQPMLLLVNTDLQLRIMEQEARVAEQQNNLRITEQGMQDSYLRRQQQIIQTDFELKRLKDQYDRTKTLFEKNVASEQEFNQLKEQYDYAVKNRELAAQQFVQDSVLNAQQLIQITETAERMTNNLNFAMKQVENLLLKTPLTGQLTAFDAEIGQNKMRGEPLGVIHALDQGYRAEVNVDEFYLPRVKFGQQATFPMAGENFRMKISRIIPNVVNGNFVVYMDFMGAIPANMRTGQTIHTKIELSELTEALLIPRGGFYSSTGGNWIFVVDPSTKMAVRRKIRTGKQNNTHLEILEGLQPDEFVITNTYDTYGDPDKLILEGDLDKFFGNNNN